MSARSVSLALAASLSLHASAAPTAVLDLVVRQQGEAAWQDTVLHAMSGMPAVYECAIFVSFTEGAAFAAAEFNITGTGAPTLTTVDASGTGLGALAPFDAASSTAGVFWSGDSFRIDDVMDIADDPAEGLAVVQLPPVLSGPDFNTQNPVMVFRFDLTIEMTDTFDLHLNIDEIAGLAVYTTTTGAGGTDGLDLSDISADGARIVVPAPAAWLAFAPAALVGTRRRRA